MKNLPGVGSVRSGYMGGDLPNPTYEEICSGQTGHAEVVEVVYDPATTKLTDLLGIFFQMHDPTSLNRQGADVGTQYRSAVFTTTSGQAETARRVVEQLAADRVYSRPIVTEVTPATTFYPAEDYHQNFFRRQPHSPYCRLVIQPKLMKLFPEAGKEPVGAMD